jgi:hypothetical protein
MSRAPWHRRLMAARCLLLRAASRRSRDALALWRRERRVSRDRVAIKTAAQAALGKSAAARRKRKTKAGSDGDNSGTKRGRLASMAAEEKLGKPAAAAAPPSRLLENLRLAGKTSASANSIWHGGGNAANDHHRAACSLLSMAYVPLPLSPGSLAGWFCWRHRSEVAAAMRVDEKKKVRLAASWRRREGGKDGYRVWRIFALHQHRSVAARGIRRHLENLYAHISVAPAFASLANDAPSSARGATHAHWRKMPLRALLAFAALARITLLRGCAAARLRGASNGIKKHRLL